MIDEIGDAIVEVAVRQESSGFWTALFLRAVVEDPAGCLLSPSRLGPSFRAFEALQ